MTFCNVQCFHQSFPPSCGSSNPNVGPTFVGGGWWGRGSQFLPSGLQSEGFHSLSNRDQKRVWRTQKRWQEEKSLLDWIDDYAMVHSKSIPAVWNIQDRNHFFSLPLQNDSHILFLLRYVKLELSLRYFFKCIHIFPRLNAECIYSYGANVYCNGFSLSSHGLHP